MPWRLKSVPLPEEQLDERCEVDFATGGQSSSDKTEPGIDVLDNKESSECVDAFPSLEALQHVL